MRSFRLLHQKPCQHQQVMELLVGLQSRQALRIEEIGSRSLASYVDDRYQGVVRQQLDYSCGAAALATLLVHQWGDSVSEAQVIATLSLILPQTNSEVEAQMDYRCSTYTFGLSTPNSF